MTDECRKACRVFLPRAEQLWKIKTDENDADVIIINVMMVMMMVMMMMMIDDDND